MPAQRASNEIDLNLKTGERVAEPQDEVYDLRLSKTFVWPSLMQTAVGGASLRAAFALFASASLNDIPSPVG